MLAIVGAILFGGIAVMTLLVACGASLGEFTMGGQYKVLPKSMRVMAGISVVIQLFAIIIVLQAGGYMSLWLSPKVTKGICLFYAVYLSVNILMNLSSKSKKERYVMTVLSLVAAICFWNTGLNMDTIYLEKGEQAMNKVKIDKLFNNVMKNKNVYQGVLYIEDTNGNVSYSYNQGGSDLDTPMVMASITKLFTTTCILALIEEGKLALNTPITQYFNEEAVRGLHSYKGKDYTSDITIRHLLCQTSGLPDFYLEGKAPFLSKVIQEDMSYSFEEELRLTKEIESHFVPGKQGKAYYSDINFDLLGKIIEGVTQLALQEAYDHYIFEPLKLEHTYLITGEEDFVPQVYYKEEKLHRPLYLSSCQASGGGVTTARELMTFLKSFWKGELFDVAILKELEVSNPLQLSFYPIRYVGGYMHIEASYPFGKKTRLVGHSGSTGSFAFYAPEKDLFFVGDIPQIAKPIGVRLVMRAVLE